jgi:hypothetical protein
MEAKLLSYGTLYVLGFDHCYITLLFILGFMEDNQRVKTDQLMPNQSSV